MARPFHSDRQWIFEQSTEELWTRIARTDQYRVWWPWLSHFEPSDGLRESATWRCEVAPPLPYVVRFTVEIDHVDPNRLVETTVRGDVKGRAVLTLDEMAPGVTRARLVSSLEPANPVLRTVGAMARPLVQWGHDWVLDQGRRQFVERGKH